MAFACRDGYINTVDQALCIAHSSLPYLGVLVSGSVAAYAVTNTRNVCTNYGEFDRSFFSRSPLAPPEISRLEDLIPRRSRNLNWD